MIKTSIITALLTLAAVLFIAPESKAAEVNGKNVSSVRYQDPDTGQLVQIKQNHRNLKHQFSLRIRVRQNLLLKQPHYH